MKKLHSVFALSALLLSACGGSLQSTVDGGSSAVSTTATSSTTASSEAASTSEPATSASTEATASASAEAIASASSEPSATSTPSPVRTVVVTTDETLAANPNTGVSTAASAENSAATTADQGRGVPAGAITLTKDSRGDVGLKTPSGNIGCDFIENGAVAYCSVISYIHDRKYPLANGFVGSTFHLDSNDLTPQHQGGAPNWTFSATTAEYGQTYTYGNYVCDSQENGLTCWNTTTGRGVFMNRDGYEVVTR